MAYLKTNWIDRVVQYANRYKDQNNNQYTFTADNGTITAEGTPLNAVNLNKIENELSILDLATVYEAAGGSVTAIVLTLPTLFDGMIKNFVASGNNNGATTTVNGKRLYKPNTSISPTLISGKGYTIRYSLSTDDFFLVASASGNTIAAHVLAPDLFSNEDDTDIPGTMPDNSNLVNQILVNNNQSFTIPLGYHSGTKTVKTQITNLTAANVPSGKIIGNVEGNWSGDATAADADVLKDKTYYHVGVKGTGNMVDKSGLTTAAPTVTPTSQSSGILDITIPETAKYNTASKLRITDPDAIAANIVKDKNMFGLIGTFDSNLYNFPISIQDAQPTALATGHIWIKSATLASSITVISILEVLNAGVANGTLMFIVGDLIYQNYSVSHSKSLTTGGNAMTLTVADNTGGSGWVVSNNTGNMTNMLTLNKPMVYSKVDGVLDIETAYMWNGSAWVLLCQKGTYALFNNYSLSPIFAVYNNINNIDFTLNNTFTGSPSNSFSFSRDGTYAVCGTKVFKRIGDIYTLYFTIPSAINGVACTDILTAIAGNGSKLIVYGWYSAYHARIGGYTDNGTTFVADSTVIDDITLTTQNHYLLAINGTGTSFIITYATTGESCDLYVYFSDGAGGWIKSNKGGVSSSINMIKYSYDGSILYSTHTYSGSAYVYKYILNYITKTIGTGTAFSSITSNYTFSWLSTSPTDYIFFVSTDGVNNTLNCKRADGTLMSFVNAPSMAGINSCFAFNADDTKMLFMGSNGYAYYYYSLSTAGTVITFTLIKTGSIDAQVVALIPA